MKKKQKGWRERERGGGGEQSGKAILNTGTNGRRKGREGGRIRKCKMNEVEAEGMAREREGGEGGGHTGKTILNTGTKGRRKGRES